MCSHTNSWISSPERTFWGGAEVSIGGWRGLQRQFFSPIFATKGHVISSPARLIVSPPSLLRLPCTKPRSILGSYGREPWRFVFFPSKWCMLGILEQKGQIRIQTKKKCIHSPFLSTFTTQPGRLQPRALVNWLCYGLWPRSSLWLRYISLPFALSFPSYGSAATGELAESHSVRDMCLRIFPWEAKIECKHTSSITLGPDTQGQLQSTRISAPQSNRSALPPATFLHPKYRGLEMDTLWVKPETGPKRSGCPAHTHVQRPAPAPCGSETTCEMAAPGTDAG